MRTSLLRIFITSCALLAAGVPAAVATAGEPVTRADRVDRADPADCTAPGHFRVLQPEAQAWPEARALWLDDRRLQWPAVPAAPAGTVQARLLLADGPTVRATAGQVPQGADQVLVLQPDEQALPAEVAAAFRHLAPGPRWQLPADVDLQQRRRLHRGQVVLALVDAEGRVLQATRVQHAAALDTLYADAADPQRHPLGVMPPGPGAGRSLGATTFSLWAPTAQAVALCLHARHDRQARPSNPAPTSQPLQADDTTGLWHAAVPGDLTGHTYTYLVDVLVPGHGRVRQRVTDPYSISLNADSQRSWVGRLDDPRHMPPGWARAPRPPALAGLAELSIYELHLRDFSVGDRSVPAAHRGRYTAFTVAGSAGMRHLRALARAGLTDVHLLPVFDLATVPERGCTTPRVPQAAPDSLAQQAAVRATAATDCYNWGYDPLHFNAPEGSYASRADDGAVRIREFRRMVMALHAAGLRVGMDVVYNHLSASGQDLRSVLDRIVPGYYHRLDEAGRVTTSTCCANSATEHRMMGRLMLDSVRLWARHYRIDSFRFDLMGHQPLAVMQQLQTLLQQDSGRFVPLLGEGWNFGEVADGARFVQAAQLQLAGSGVASFSDRARDALRGGGHGDDGAAQVSRKGWLSGSTSAEHADLVRLGLAGTLRSVRFTQADGQVRRGDELRYANQIAGYAQQPGEVVNYVENHDNQTLWDLLAFKLPPGTPARDRAHAQVLGLAVTALSQGVAYFHAGVDLLRSKSMDVNSYDSGDWFNRLDWQAQTNFFGTGLPPAGDNGALHALMAPRLRDPGGRPAPADIALARQALRDWLAVRASSRLFRLATADEVQQRLQFLPLPAPAAPDVIVYDLDGRGLPGAGFDRVRVLLNPRAEVVTLALPPGPVGPAAPASTVGPASAVGPAAASAPDGRRWALHPVLAAPGAADRRLHAVDWAAQAQAGQLPLPPRAAVVLVQR